MSNFREPQVAGYFYPGNSEKLKNEINLMLDISKPDEELKNLFGIVAPHAGYPYSGKTAAYAYNLLKDKNIKTVIIISPSHREYFPGISVYSGDAYETPLGKVTVNKNIANKLTENSNSIFESEQGHGPEHAIEVHIPFLQTILNDFEIVPVVMGDQSKVYVDELAEKLSEVVDDSTLVLASSDLSHFHSKEEANKLDSVVEERINNFQFEELMNDLESKNCEACGGGPIVAMMKAASLKNKSKAIILDRSDSGDTTGDYSEVVGYLSAAVYGD